MGRGRSRAFVAAGLVALAVGAVVFAGPASGEDQTAASLKAACLADGTDCEKRMLLEELKELDTSSAHDALEELAASSNPEVAILALHTIGRAGYSGAQDALETAFEDESRHEAVRAAAFQAWARLACANGTSWEEAEEYGRSKCCGSKRLDGAVLAARNAVEQGE